MFYDAIFCRFNKKFYMHTDVCRYLALTYRALSAFNKISGLLKIITKTHKKT